MEVKEGQFDADAKWNNIDQFVLTIETLLDSSYLVRYGAVDECQNLDQFYIYVGDIKELFQEVTSKLNLHPVNTCTVSWFVHMLYLCQVLTSTKTVMDHLSASINLLPEELQAIAKIRQKVAQLFVLVNETQIQLFSKANSALITSNVVGFMAKSKKFSTVISDLFIYISNLIDQDVAVDIGLLNTIKLRLTNIGEFVKNLYLESTKSLRQSSDLVSITFGLLVSFCKIAYISGNSVVLADIFLSPKLISPETPIQLMKSFHLKIFDVVCFYKYMAFNLFWLSIDGFDTINEAYNMEASSYFRCILSFPADSQYSDVSQNKDASTKFNVGKHDESVIKSEEFSLLYILHSVLMSNDLDDLDDLTRQPYFFSEISNLLRTLSKALSSSIKEDTLSSKPSSFSSGGHGATVPDDVLGGDHIEVLKFQSLGSVLYNGTYREKQLLVFEFLKHLLDFDINGLSNNFSLDSNPGSSSFQRLFELTDPAKYPGTIAYYKLLDLVTKVLRVFKLRYIVKSLGPQKLDATKLKSVLGDISKLELSLNLKNNLEVTKDNDDLNRYLISIPKLPLEEQNEVIKRQVKLAKSIQELELLSTSLSIDKT